MSVVRFLPIILLTCINQSFGYSNSNEFDSEPQPKTDNANLKKDACNLASTFGLKSLCASKIPDEEKESLKKQYLIEISEDVKRRGLDWYWSPYYPCYNKGFEYSSKRSQYYKYNSDIFSEDECLKTAATLKTQREIELKKQEEDRLQAARQKERERENLKKQTEQVNQDFINSPTFDKLLVVGKFLDAHKKIENAQKEQTRQKEIGNQSGYVNTSAIYNAGVTIVDNKELKKQLFQDYKKLGGIATNDAELIKLRDNCKKLDGWPIIAFYIAGVGWQIKWDETKRNDVIATASCF